MAESRTFQALVWTNHTWSWRHAGAVVDVHVSAVGVTALPAVREVIRADDIKRLRVFPRSPAGSRIRLEHANGLLHISGVKLSVLGFPLLYDRQVTQMIVRAINGILVYSDISAHAVSKLEAAKLILVSPGSRSNSPRLLVGRPVTIPGNKSRRSIDGQIGGLDADVPTLQLYRLGGYCHVTLEEKYAPGPGPRDFDNAWRNEDDAVNDILDYYFGASNRIDAPGNLGEA